MNGESAIEQAETAINFADRDRRARITRLFATLLVVLMAGIFLGTKLVPEPGYWILMVRAAAEAGIVGGLADWFAVTALFRQPLGLPIPHTAVIPRNKDRIGIGLADFVERHFLDPPLVAARVASIGPARAIGNWLSVERNAEVVAQRVAAALPYLISTLREDDIRIFFVRAMHKQLADFDVGPVLGKSLQIIRESDRHHEFFDYILRITRNYLVEHETHIQRAVADRSNWWIPARVDRRVATALTRGIIDFLASLEDREHDLRKQFDDATERLINDLQHSATYRKQLDEIKAGLLGNPQVQIYLSSLWHEFRGRLVSTAAQRDSALQKGLKTAFQTLGQSIVDDANLQNVIDRRIESATHAIMGVWRKEISGFISEVVRGWEARTVSDRIESAVGRDLQFIRINGTLVGAIIGCAIYVAVNLLP